MLNVSEHLKLLSAQFLASAMRETHPSFEIVTSLDGPRKLKNTLQSAFYGDVVPYLVDDVVPPALYNDVKNQIHADFVRRSINSRQVNPVLGTRAPPIHSHERRLPRAHRSTLSQLRSGYSSSLNSYLVKVGRADSSVCPRCSLDEHSTAHLFSCSRDRTYISPVDLWLNPRESASFLSSHPTFSHLPPLPPSPRPPQRPPPEPPPP